MAMLEDLPLVERVSQVVHVVRAVGGEAHSVSLAWDVAGAFLCERYGLDGYACSELAVRHGVCTGTVARALEGEGKCAYALKVCSECGIDPAACVAIGESCTDVPISGR